MKKIKLKNELYILGRKTFVAGTEFTVKYFNSRFVYVVCLGCTLKLSIKEVEVVR